MIHICETKKEKSELITLFAVAFVLWFTDFFTTILTLTYYGDFITEKNPIAVYFFSFGPIGYLIDLMFCTGLMILILVLFPVVYSYFICRPLDNLFFKMHLLKKKKTAAHYRDYTRFVRIFATGMIVGQETLVLVLNWLTIRPSLIGLA